MATSSSSSVGVVGLLGVAFVVLKLTGVIEWSWWWVTLPFWAGLAAVAAVGAGFLVWFVTSLTLTRIKQRKARAQRRPF